MATIHDNFNRADADALGASAEGWSWVEAQGDNDIASNECRGGAVSLNFAYANITLGSADHYAELVPLNLGDSLGPCVRCDTASDTYYCAIWDGSITRLVKVVSGTQTVVDTFAGTFGGIGRTLRLSVSGSTLEAFDNGVSLGTISDGDITGHTRAGVRTSHINDRLDNFEAGSLAGGSSSVSPSTSPSSSVSASPSPSSAGVVYNILQSFIISGSDS